jgi:drug/metabolite transporter (DMT)-like permease
MQLSLRLLVLLILPPLLWACNSVVARLAIDSIGPLWLNALRWGLALLLLLPLGWKILATPEARARIRARWAYLGMLGLIGVGAYNALQYVALRTSTPVNVTLIASSLPLWAMIVGALFYRVHPTRPQLLGAVLSLAGVLTVLARGDPSALLRIQLVEGDLLMVLAIIGWASYSWMLVRPPAHMRGAARPAWDWAEFLFAQCLFGACVAFAAAGMGEAVAASITPRWSWQLVAIIIFIAVGPSIIAYRAWGLAVAEAGPAIAAVFYNLTPLITAVLSVMVIGEWPQAYHGVAFLLIVAGILVASRSAAARPV